MPGPSAASPAAVRAVAVVEIGCGLLAAVLLVVSAQQSAALAVGERPVLDVAFPYVLAVLALALLGGRGVRRLRAASRADR